MPCYVKKRVLSEEAQVQWHEKEDENEVIARDLALFKGNHCKGRFFCKDHSIKREIREMQFGMNGPETRRLSTGS